MGNIQSDEQFLSALQTVSKSDGSTQIVYKKRQLGDGESMNVVKIIDMSVVNEETVGVVQIPNNHQKPNQQLPVEFPTSGLPTIESIKMLGNNLTPLDKPKNNSIICKIVSIDSRQSGYIACLNCKKKVEAQSHRYYCKTCQKEVQAQFSYCVKMHVRDETGSMDLVAFREVGQQIIGMSPNSWRNLKESQRLEHIETMNLNIRYRMNISTICKWDGDEYKGFIVSNVVQKLHRIY